MPHRRPPYQQLVTGTFLCPTCETRQLFVKPSLKAVMEVSWMIKPKYDEPVLICQRCEDQVPTSEARRPRFGVDEEYDFSTLRLLCGVSYVLNNFSVPIASQQRIRAVFEAHRGHKLPEDHLSEELIHQVHLNGQCEPCLRVFSLHFSDEHRADLVRAAVQVIDSEGVDRQMALALIEKIGLCLDISAPVVKRALGALGQSA